MDTPANAEDRLLAALAYPYWYIAFPVYLLSNRYQSREYVRYHVFQGLLLGLVVLWGGAVLWTTAAILGKFGLFGLLLYPILKLAEWGARLTTLYAAFMALSGKKVELPYITEFVRPMLHSRPRGQ